MRAFYGSPWIGTGGLSFKQTGSVQIGEAPLRHLSSKVDRGAWSILVLSASTPIGRTHSILFQYGSTNSRRGQILP